MASMFIGCCIWIVATALLAICMRKILKGKKWKIATIFLTYVGTMGSFAHVYKYMYSVDTSWFTFASDIEETRRKELAGDERVDVDRLNALETAFSELQDQVFKQKANISPSDRKAWLVQVSCTHYRFEFNFTPNWSTEDNQFVRHGRVVVKNSEGVFLGSESVKLTGPTTVALTGLSPRKRDELFESTFPPKNSPSILALLPSISDSLVSAREQIDSPELRLGPATQEDWDFPDFLYFSVITQTTVGYGDILPNSSPVRICVIAQVIIGLVILGIAITWVTIDPSPQSATL